MESGITDYGQVIRYGRLDKSLPRVFEMEQDKTVHNICFEQTNFQGEKNKEN